MFEKCGLKDIFYRIFALKWYLIALVVIFTVVEIGGYACLSKVTSSTGSSSTSSQLCYYIESPQEENTDTYYDPFDSAINSRSNFIKTTEGMMKSKAVCSDIHDKLLAVYTEDEITKNIGSIGNDWQNYYKNLYTLDTETGSTIIIDINAVTNDGIEVVTNVIKLEMDEIAASLGDCTLNLYSESYVPIADSSTSGFSLSTKLLAEIIIIAMVLTIIVALAIAIFNPTINRGSDIDEYGVSFLGIVSDKKIEISARIIAKMMQEKGIKRLAIATSLKKNKFEEIVAKLNAEISKVSVTDALEVTLANRPCAYGEAFDICVGADAVMTLEKRGFTSHKKYAEMLSLLANFDVKIVGGMLQ